ncbi:hypothetical protein L1987_84959 [Smallanthus sonchifolius]|uniref:Uncharacterized protein n=1 Tax=Smallanthus sonchifolius TaxID=185202 RepID=A0ACB8XUK7_9ASTR|nr:hypothetical protein L1987_84959 [Smallanthus sonchifolius]
MDSYSYADSGGSSLRSRDVDLQPWEAHSSTKVKFMCSYGGKIHPRPHDNQLSYVGGETKILAVDRTVKFATVIAKLKALCDRDVCFKYQLPGEDLDALISVTNEDDLEHMMHEYDRLNKASNSPAKLRLFLFHQTTGLTPVHSFGSTEAGGNMELVFGLEKGIPSGVSSRSQDPDLHILPQEQETEVMDEQAHRIQKHIHDLQKLRITEEQQPAMYRRPSNDNLAAGDYYAPKMTENVAPASEYQMAIGFTASPDQQPVYMIQPPASMYHAPNAIPVTAPGQGYYVQRMPAREQPVYSVMPPVATQQTIVSSQQQFVAQTGYQMVTDGQVAGAGRQIYYTTNVAQPQQPLQQQYQATAGVATVTLNQENVAANLKEFM